MENVKQDWQVENHLTAIGLRDQYILRDSADHIGAPTLMQMQKVHGSVNPEETFMYENTSSNKRPYSVPEVTKPLLDVLNRIPESENEKITNNLQTITTLANKPREEVTKADRKEYKIKVREIMDIVIGMHKKRNQYSADEALHVIPLNGGLIFRDQVVLNNLATYSLEIQAKRLDLVEIAGTSGKEGFMAIATGKHKLSSEIAKEQINQIICVDDCLSTALTQIAMIEEALASGFRPKEISVLVTVATTGGAKHLFHQIELLKQKYNAQFDFKLNFGAMCMRVDDKMYLRTMDGSQFLVGDMGWWLANLAEYDEIDEQIVIEES